MIAILQKWLQFCKQIIAHLQRGNNLKNKCHNYLHIWSKVPSTLYLCHLQWILMSAVDKRFSWKWTKHRPKSLLHFWSLKHLKCKFCYFTRAALKLTFWKWNRAQIAPISALWHNLDIKRCNADEEICLTSELEKFFATLWKVRKRIGNHDYHNIANWQFQFQCLSG